MAALVDELATRAGEPILDEDGDKLYGNHSWKQVVPYTSPA